MICTNCKDDKKEDDFPTYKELFPDFPNWCRKCIHEEVQFRYHEWQDERNKKLNILNN